MDQQTPQWAQRSNRSKYAFATVEVGHSFYVKPEEQTCAFSSFRVMASVKGKDLGRKFHVRIVPEGEEHAGSFQCWRSR